MARSTKERVQHVALAAWLLFAALTLAFGVYAWVYYDAQLIVHRREIADATRDWRHHCSDKREVESAKMSRVCGDLELVKDGISAEKRAVQDVVVLVLPCSGGVDASHECAATFRFVVDNIASLVRTLFVVMCALFLAWFVVIYTLKRSVNNDATIQFALPQIMGGGGGAKTKSC